MKERVPGHNLWGEGAAYTEVDGQLRRAQDGVGIAGIGFAVCSCGERSLEVFTRGRARQRWHRRHKEIVTEAAVPIPEPQGPIEAVRRSLRLTADRWAWIDEQAEAGGLTRHQFVAQLIDTARSPGIGSSDRVRA